ncbi:Phosphoacetylglucosamine Mutase [Orbilia blumenaviensis]|uniref:Phosphoacetylglucosamine mutase n=1 Tax=Orbilia blumenaviensis TaxID=1796055 RepID=A0AAV9U440_9PEZI
MSQEAVIAASKAYPKPAQTFQYGTAGFRMKADLLPSVVFRVGLLAALRSRYKNGQVIGVMITASHNPPADNGVKLIDPMGEMLESSWEAYGTALANAEDDQAVYDYYTHLEQKFNIKSSVTPQVIYGSDTRESSPALVQALKDALDAVGVKSQAFGAVTTPQLHYLVRCLNTEGTDHAYGKPTLEGYYSKLSTAFNHLMTNRSNGSVTVDCANGVGGPALRELQKHLNPDSITIIVTNDDTETFSKLNSQSGADYVKTNQRLPPSVTAQPLARYASLDGDADRIVYYYVDAKTSTFHLLDGDKIATLAASFIGDLVHHSGITDFSIGVVQTAYANGSSTAYIEKQGLPTVCTPTGVKHLHHAALAYDCGVYFEANGHGTVLFSPSALQRIFTHEPESPAQATAITHLKNITELINQTVGDALSDLLLVEVILAHKAWTPDLWDACYTDLPNRLEKAEVVDRNAFKTTDAERKLTHPAGLQDQIDALVGKYDQARSFVRPSGTENVVRVYAEAATRTQADELAQKVKALLR